MTSMRESNLAYTNGEHPIHGTWLSVDVIAITEDVPESRIVLIKRKGTPYKGSTTLPGGLLAAWDGETVEDAAKRILREKAGLEIVGQTTTLDVISDPERDERGHTVSIVVAARVSGDVRSGVPGAVYLEDLPEMPFGHTGMVHAALSRLGERLLTDPSTTYALLGNETTVWDTFALLRLSDPDITDVATRARLDRSSLYRSTNRSVQRLSGRSGRPSKIFERA